MDNKMIRVAITQGDTNGIGYEVIFKALSDPTILELCTPIIYGSPKVAAYHRKALNMQANFSIIANASEAQDGRVNMLNTTDEEVKVDLGTPTPESAKAARTAIDRAADDWEAGLFDVLVSAPCTAEAINQASSVGTYIAQRSEPAPKVLTICQNGGLHLAVLAPEVPFDQLPSYINKENVTEMATLFYQSLKRDLRINNPRMALLSFNSTAGKEEEEVLKPVTDELREKKVYAFGPFPADEFFGNGQYSFFDGVMAMYHDQGLIPFKLLSEGRGIELTSGLSGVLTSAAHGPAFDIAGKGCADESALRNAIYTAIDACRARADYDEPLANPLKKLYHERRDDSEKVRFKAPAVPKEQKSPRSQGEEG